MITIKIQYNDAQHNDAQHNDANIYDDRYNVTLHTNTERNGIYCDSKHNFTVILNLWIFYLSLSKVTLCRMSWRSTDDSS